MPRHDYDLPGDWAAMSDEERDRWFKQERARRQATNQRTPFAARMEKQRERLKRRRESHWSNYE